MVVLITTVLKVMLLELLVINMVFLAEPREVVEPHAGTGGIGDTQPSHDRTPRQGLLLRRVIGRRARDQDERGSHLESESDVLSRRLHARDTGDAVSATMVTRDQTPSRSRMALVVS